MERHLANSLQMRIALSHNSQSRTQNRRSKRRWRRRRRRYSGFCSMRSFQPKHRSSDVNQSAVWSVLEMVGTGLVDMRTRTTSPRCSSCRCLPSKQTQAGLRESAGSRSSSSA